MLYLYFNHL